MKTKKLLKKELCLVLAVALISTTVFAATDAVGTQAAATQAPAAEPAGEETAVPKAAPETGVEGDEDKKTETVYVTLDAQGNPTETIVTDWLHSATPNAQLTDRTTLESFENIKGDEVPLKNGQDLVWKLNGSDLYYRGTTGKELPVKVNISYTLDGKAISAQELAGKSGLVEIHISFRNTDVRTVDVNGNPVTMYAPVMVAGGVILPEETFRNIVVSDGKLISDGSNQVAAFAVAPGLDESLNLSDSGIDALEDLALPEEITIRAQATEFELGNMAFVMTTSLEELTDLGDSEDIDDLKESLEELKDVKDLALQLDPDRRLRSLYLEPSKTDAARLLTDDIFEFYEMDTDIADVLGKYVNQENIELYDKIKADTEFANLSYLLDSQVIKDLPDSLNDENIDKARKLLTDFDEIQEMDMDKIRKAIDTLDDCDSLSSLISKSRKLVKKISKHEDEVDTLKKLMSYQDETVTLIKQLQALNAALPAGMELDKDDVEAMVEVLVERKLDQAQDTPEMQQMKALLELDSADMVQDDGTVAEPYRKAVLTCIGLAEKNGALPNEQISAETLSLLKKGVSAGSVANPQSEEATGMLVYALRSVIEGVQEEIQDQLDALEGNAEQLVENLTSQVWKLMGNAQTLVGEISQKISQEDLEDTIDFAQELLPDLKSLMKLVDKNDDEISDLEELLDDAETMEYLQKKGRTLVSMADDLDENEDNVQLMRDLLALYDDPQMANLPDAMDDLQDDLDRARILLEDLKAEFEDPRMDESLHNAPETTQKLLKIKKDIEDNREIAEILRLATNTQNAQLATQILLKLDDLEEKDKEKDYSGSMDRLEEVLDRADAYSKLAEENTIFTAAADGMKTETKFVIKTAEIKKPEPEPVQTQTSVEKASFWDSLKGKVQAIFQKDK